MGLDPAFVTHLASGATTVCRCWAVTRRDGMVLGFTDHDLGLSFDGIEFSADTGMSARTVEQTSGLAVDNTEALGVLNHAAVTDDDIDAGRYDGASVRAWLVNWADVAERLVLFAGTIGEIKRSRGTFTAELRGLSEDLNRPQGLVFQKPCSAVLGDARCRFDPSQAGYAIALPAEGIEDQTVFTFASLPGFDEHWFERGRFVVETGPAAGLSGIIKNDRIGAGVRRIELWEALRAPVAPGDTVRLEAGCDKRADTCRLKFNNLLNYRGFPDIPSEDWLMAVPRKSGLNTGGSRTS